MELTASTGLDTDIERFDGPPQVCLWRSLLALRVAKCNALEFHYQVLYAIFMPAGLDFLMHFTVDEKRNSSDIGNEARLQAPLYPGSAILRRALRGNLVSFPSQIPILLKRPSADMQRRMVLLFFVLGWRSAKIAARFNVPKHHVWESLNEWSVRAMAVGYVRVIDPEAFAACCRVEYGQDHETEEIPLAEVEPVLRNDVDLIAAKDLAIAHCEESRVRTATLLRDLIAAAATARKLGRGSEQTDGLFTVLQTGTSSLQRGLRARGTEQVPHAVA
jgi:hypothetical protein